MHSYGKIAFTFFCLCQPYAGAQTQAPAGVDETAPATVVITAPRSGERADYRATESRIERLLARRPVIGGSYMSWCMTHRFLHPPGSSVRLSTFVMDARINCDQGHILAKDTLLRRALDAFGRRDDAVALDLFKRAYVKMGTQDAALMLAKMHFDGLGTPRDPAQGIRWLVEIVDGKFDPQKDWVRPAAGTSRTINARIEAATLLARIYEQGDIVARDAVQARKWAGRALQFGYVPLLTAAERDLAATTRQVATHGSEPAIPYGPAGNAFLEEADRLAPLSPRDDAAVLAASTPVRESEPRLDALAGRRTMIAASQAPSEEADPHMFMVVRVTGLRAVPWKSYRAMRAAVAAFEEYKSLAPDALFRFALMPPPGKSLPANFALRVRNRDGVEFPIALENGELFQLPVLPQVGMDADLVSNFKDGALRIGLLVHTRSVPSEKERLGDVRLRAAITQAIVDVDNPVDDPRCLRKRPGHNSCKARQRAVIWHNPRAPATGAWIVEGARREALASNQDPRSPSYKMPVAGGRWGDDAIIEFDYVRPASPPRLSEVAVYAAGD